MFVLLEVLIYKSISRRFKRILELAKSHSIKISKYIPSLFSNKTIMLGEIVTCLAKRLKICHIFGIRDESPLNFSPYFSSRKRKILYSKNMTKFHWTISFSTSALISKGWLKWGKYVVMTKPFSFAKWRMMFRFINFDS